MTQYAAFVIFPLLMLIAAVSDLLTMKISNYLTAGLLISFFLMAYLIGMPWQDLAWASLCGLAVLLVTFGMFAMGWVGGGDAKLVSASALWMGWSLLLPYLVIASLFGGVLTIILLVFRRFGLPSFLAGRAWAMRLHQPRGGVPYGIALAASGLFFYPNTQIWLAAIGA